MITAAYRAAAYLPKAISSVANQNDPNIEHIVVDNLSDDGTIELLRNQECPSLRWISERDRGQSDAINKGVRLATGDWILWLNADDEIAPGALLAFRKTLARRPDADLIYGHVRIVDEQGRTIKIKYELPFLYSFVVAGLHAPPSTGTFFRRDVLLREPLSEDFHFVMDTEWFLRCGKGLSAVRCDQIFSHFRILKTAKTSAQVMKGETCSRHQAEVGNYRKKHHQSKWPGSTPAEIEERIRRLRRLLKPLYYFFKLPFAGRYFNNWFKKIEWH